MEHGVRLTVAYDGTEFAGFQRQPDTRTVQGVLERAAEQITQHAVLVRGAGRTDAGVHAQGQIVAFATSRELPPRRWLLALNRYLPDDVSVHDVAPCSPNYDPRFDALDKTYRYLFYLRLARNPLLRTRAWHLGRDARVPDDDELVHAHAQLDLDAMRRTCEHLVGTHDFAAFRAADDVRENTKRTILRADLIESFAGEPQLLAFEVQGSAFMKNMVRILAGTLIAVGRGKRTPDEVAARLMPGQSRDVLAETAPAHGLTMVRVRLGRLHAQALLRDP
jgi:tRNA pseudouridine38-40 synthase